MNASSPFGSASSRRSSRAFTLIERLACPTKPPGRRRSSRAFTLIELLVVIGIIGILMAILMPAIGGARKAALRRRAATEVKNIEAAILSYLNDYGRFPMQNQPVLVDKTYSGPNYASLIKILRADPSDPTNLNNYNPQRKVYLQVKDTSIDITSSNKGAFLDPWENNYYVRADFNYDNKIQYTAAGDAREIRGRNVIVWSSGPKARAGVSDTDPSDNIKSFED